MKKILPPSLLPPSPNFPLFSGGRQILAGVNKDGQRCATGFFANLQESKGGNPRPPFPRNFFLWKDNNSIMVPSPGKTNGNAAVIS